MQGQVNGRDIADDPQTLTSAADVLCPRRRRMTERRCSDSCSAAFSSLAHPRSCQGVARPSRLRNRSQRRSSLVVDAILFDAVLLADAKRSNWQSSGFIFHGGYSDILQIALAAHIKERLRRLCSPRIRLMIEVVCARPMRPDPTSNVSRFQTDP